MPAYHAVRTLSQTLDAIPKEWVDDIILVDDASSDDTANLARSLGITTIVHQKNMGYGGNQKTCYQEALKRGADIVVMVHPDFQYDPQYIPEMVLPIAEGTADAVFGSRMLIPGSALKGGMPYWKYLANKGLTLIENAVLGLNLSEYHSGFRAYSRELLETLPLEKNSNNFVFDSEIVVQSAFAGFRIREIPISTRYFKEASMIGFWRSVQYGLMILELMTHAVLFRTGLRKDPRFSIHRYQCPVCSSQSLILLYPASADLKSLISQGYRITEASVGLHGNIYQCLRCASAYQPFIEDEALRELYASQPEDEVYLSEETGRRRAFRTILKRIERYIPRGRLIDVGAGPGFLLLEAKERGWGVSGIEPSKNAVAHARNLKLEVTQGTVSDLRKLPEGSADVVTGMDVIEHLDRPGEFFQEVWRVLKPGGVLVVTTPKFDSFLRIVLGNRWYAILPTHLTYFSGRGLCMIARTHGFETLAIRHMTRYFSPAYLWYRLCGLWNKNPSHRAVRGASRRQVPVQLFDEYEAYFRKGSKVLNQENE